MRKLRGDMGRSGFASWFAVAFAGRGGFFGGEVRRDGGEEIGGGRGEGGGRGVRGIGIGSREGGGFGRG